MPWRFRLNTIYRQWVASCKRSLKRKHEINSVEQSNLILKTCWCSPDRTTLIRQRIDVMVGSPTCSKKSWQTFNICGFLENYVTNTLISNPAWTIISTLSIQSENIDTEMLVCDRHTNEHTALKWLGGEFTCREKGWCCSRDRISQVYLDQHQQRKVKLKFLYI